MAAMFRGGAPFGLGVAIATAAAVADQAVKAWLVVGSHLSEQTPPLPLIGPFIDLRLVWNPGMSLGMFRDSGGMLFAFQIAAVAVMAVWLMRTRSRLTAAALGFIIGGAIGNLIDRVRYDRVMDFLHLKVPLGGGEPLSLFVFNLADAAITAGVALLIYESLFVPDAAKAP
jgi:signal peptidase II